MLKLYRRFRMWLRVQSYKPSAYGLYDLSRPGLDVYNERIYAGAFKDAPPEMVRVCLAGELRDKYDNELSIDWPDFSPPPPEVRELLEEVRMHLRFRHPVYVGCFGGTGRTGTFLALLAKMDGVLLPVAWVRKNYRSHAVETEDQLQFVIDYEV